MTQNLSDRVSVKTAAMQGPFYASNNSNTTADATGANTEYGTSQNLLNTLAEGTYKIVPLRSIALKDQLALVGFEESMRVDLEKRYPRKKLPIGPWQTYTPTITNGPAMASNTARWRRVGSAIEIQAVMIPSVDGTSALDLLIGLPSGLTAVTVADIAVGSGFGFEENGTSDEQTQVVPVTANTTSIRFYGRDPGGTTGTTLNGDDIGTSTGYIRYLTFHASIEVNEYAADSENYGISFSPQSDDTVNVEVGAKADENTDWTDLTGIYWALEHKGPTTYSAIDGTFDTVSADVIQGKSGDGPAIKGRTDGAPGAGEVGEIVDGGLFGGASTTSRDTYETLDTISISAGVWIITACGNGVVNSPTSGSTFANVRLRDTTNSATLAVNAANAMRNSTSTDEDSARYIFSMTAPIVVTGTTSISIQHSATGTASAGTITTVGGGFFAVRIA